MLKCTTYQDVKRIIEKGLPRVIYLPYKIAVRVGNEVYVKLLPHERLQFTRRLTNDTELSRLELHEEDFLLSLVSMTKGEENYLKVRGKLLTTDDILKDRELQRMFGKKQRINTLLNKLTSLGYIEVVQENGETHYKLTSKTLLPERTDEKFKVIAID